MGERYLVTGAQLGMFQAFAKAKDPTLTDKLVNDIIDEQFIGNTENPIKEDVQTAKKVFFK